MRYSIAFIVVVELNVMVEVDAVVEYEVEGGA